MTRSRKNPDPSIPGQPRYRLHKASGQAAVQLAHHTVYLGKYGTPEAADRYRHEIAEWVARGRRPAEPEAAPLSVNELVLAYVGWAGTYYRARDGQPNAKELWNVNRAMRPLCASFGMTAARDFGPRKLALVQERFLADGLTRSGVNRYVSRIKHLFKWAVAQELVPAATWQSVAALEGLRRGHTDAPEPEPVRPVPDGLVDAIEAYVSRQVWGLIQVQRLSGCRPGEAVILRGCDLDMSGPLWTYKPAFHKTERHGQERVVVVGPRAQAVLREFLTPDTQAYLFNPTNAEQERRDKMHVARKTPLSCGNRPGTHRQRRPQRRPGERYTVGSYRRAVQVGCDKAFPAPAGMDDDARRQWQSERRWHPHQLRHTFATTVRKTFGLDAAQVTLGHATADITQIYAEKNLALAQNVAMKIG
jgi:integrase